ncbi:MULTISPECIES: hypothetical protein [Arthrobacter]|uniref:hypothetical protein n=1 Tax=Arthrobacter TaxID=1663 RepID=UPI000B410DB4|nr:hypothetical protein [Arthrobacter globiformis]
MDEYRQQKSAQAAFLLSGLSALQAWIAYYGNGGRFSETDVDAYLHGLMPFPLLQRDLIAFTLNELLSDDNLPDAASYAEDNSWPPIRGL